MRKVLFITYHFPPSGSSKTRRTLMFLKYLRDHSWLPVVLTVKEGGHWYFSFDPSLIDKVPRGIQISRAPTIASLLRRVKPSADFKNSKNRTTDISKNVVGPFVRIWAKFYEFINKWIGIPDAFILWAPFAIVKGISIIDRDQIDAIYSTGPPFSNHIVATILKKITRKPLATDFRDAWISDPVRRWKESKARFAIESLLEAIVIRSSEAVISTTEGISQDFRARYPLEPGNKFVLITNGYDRDTLQIVKGYKTNRPNKMRIVHTGYLSMERTPKSFLEALGLLFDERPELLGQIEVFLVGENGVLINGRHTEDYIKQYRLDSVVTLTGSVSHSEALRFQMCADILLLVIGLVPKEKVIKYGIASKVYDYMIAEKPVLTLADEGPVSKLIKETRIGDVIEPFNVRAIKEYLSNSFDLYNTGRLTVRANATEIAKYDIERLTERLARVFDACMISIH